MYEETMVNSGTLKQGPAPLLLGYKYTRTAPFSFHSSGTLQVRVSNAGER